MKLSRCMLDLLKKFSKMTSDLRKLALPTCLKNISILF